MNAARHAGERLMTWPGLSGGRAYCGTDLCVRAGSQEIVHFHGENEADVYLTHPMIDKLRPALKNSTALRLRAGSGWVTVRLDTGADIDLLATLVSAALRAADTLPVGPAAAGTPRAGAETDGTPPVGTLAGSTLPGGGAASADPCTKHRPSPLRHAS